MAGSGTAALWIRAASGLEVLTGLGLVVAPSLLARLLFGSDLNGAGEAMGRIAGLVMVCLATGCWPRVKAHRSASGGKGGRKTRRSVARAADGRPKSMR